MSFSQMIKKVVAGTLVITFGFSNASSFPVSNLPTQSVPEHPSLTREGATATSSIADIFRQFRRDNVVVSKDSVTQPLFISNIQEIATWLRSFTPSDTKRFQESLVAARSEARKPVVKVREDAKEGELAEIWGDKKINGKTLNVEETILWLAERLIGDVNNTINNWKEMEAKANAMIDKGATPEEAFAFLASNFPAKRIDENGNIVTKTAGDIYEGGINNFLLAMGEDVPVSPNRWAMNETVEASPRSKQKGMVLTGPSDKIGMLLNAFNAALSGVTSRLEDSEDASPSMSGKKIWIQQLNLKRMYEGFFKDGKFTDPFTNKEYKLEVGLDEAPAPFHRLPGIHLPSPTVTIQGKRIPAFIAIMSVFLLNNYDNLKKHNFDAGFYLPKSKWPLDMYLWNKAFFLMEERVGLPHGTIKAKVMHERAEFSLSQFVNMWVVQMYSLVTNVGRWDQNSSFVQMFKRFKSMLFADQRFSGMLTDRMTYYTWRNAFFNILAGVMGVGPKKPVINPNKKVQLVELTNALAEGGMAVQLKNNPKPSDSEEIKAAKLKYNKNAISDIRIDKIRERLIGLQMFVKSNGQKILLDSTRESWVATTDSEYANAGAEPLKVELNKNGSTLEEIVKPLQDYIDANVTPAMREKFIALNILGPDGKIKPIEFTKEDLTKEKIDSLENWKRLMMPTKGDRTIDGLGQEIFFSFDYNGQQFAGNAAAVENPLDGNLWSGILEAIYTGNRLMSDHATNEGNLNGLLVTLRHAQAFTKDGKFEDLTGTYPPLEVKAGDPITPDLVYQLWLRLKVFTDDRLNNFEAKKLPVNRPVANLVMEVVKRILIKTDENGEPVKENGHFVTQPVDFLAYFSKILFRMNEMYDAGQLKDANYVLNAIFIKTREELVAEVEKAQRNKKNQQLAKFALATHDDVFNLESQYAEVRSEARKSDQKEATRQRGIKRVAKWLKESAFRDILLLSSPEQIFNLQGTIDEGYAVAAEAGRRIDLLTREAFDKGESIVSYGPYSSTEAVVMRKRGVKIFYLGGWAGSAKGGRRQPPGADTAAYEHGFMPDEASPIVRALLEQDKIQKSTRAHWTAKKRASTPEVDFFPLIVADADNGHGSEHQVMNLVREMVEAGVGAVHLEDQGRRKVCGHQGCKVLVSTGTQIVRLSAAATQFASMKVPGIVVGRTDANEAAFMETNEDKRDARFILGATRPILDYATVNLAVLKRFDEKGIEGMKGYLTYGFSEQDYQKAYEWMEVQGLMKDLDATIKLAKQGKLDNDKALEIAMSPVHKAWVNHAGMKTVGQAIADVMQEQIERGIKFKWTVDEWLSQIQKLTNEQALELAKKELGIQIFWDMNIPRTPEGYYQITGGFEMSVARGLAFAPYAHLIWRESKDPDLLRVPDEQSEDYLFAKAIHAVFPNKRLAQNISPSFNWDAVGFTDDQIKNYIRGLGKLGYTFSFSTYAGHQQTILGAEELSQAFLENGAWGIALVQRRLRALNSDGSRPQEVVGGKLADERLQRATGNSASTKSMGGKSTAEQHKRIVEPPLSLLDGWLTEWATVNNYPGTLHAEMPFTSKDTQERVLNILDEHYNKIAHIQFVPGERVQDHKQTILIKDQNTTEPWQQRRLSTLMQLFLFHRFKTDLIRYDYYTPANQASSHRMISPEIGVLVNPSQDTAGNIIAADVNMERVKELVSDENALKALISKVNGNGKSDVARSEARNQQLKPMGMEDVKEMINSLPNSRLVKRSDYNPKYITDRTLKFGNTTVYLGVEHSQKYEESGVWQMRLEVNHSGTAGHLFDWTFLPRFRIDPRPTSILYKKNGEKVIYDEDYGFVAFGLKTIPNIHAELSSPLMLLVISDRFYQFLQSNQFDNFSGEASNFVTWKIIPESEAATRIEELKTYIGLEKFFSRSEARNESQKVVGIDKGVAVLRRLIDEQIKAGNKNIVVSVFGLEGKGPHQLVDKLTDGQKLPWMPHFFSTSDYMAKEVEFQGDVHYTFQTEGRLNPLNFFIPLKSFGEAPIAYTNQRKFNSDLTKVFKYNTEFPNVVLVSGETSEILVNSISANEISTSIARVRVRLSSGLNIRQEHLKNFVAQNIPADLTVVSRVGQKSSRGRSEARQEKIVANNPNEIAKTINAFLSQIDSIPQGPRQVSITIEGAWHKDVFLDHLSTPTEGEKIAKYLAVADGFTTSHVSINEFPKQNPPSINIMPHSASRSEARNDINDIQQRIRIAIYNVAAALPRENDENIDQIRQKLNAAFALAADSTNWHQTLSLLTEVLQKLPQRSAVYRYILDIEHNLDPHASSPHGHARNGFVSSPFHDDAGYPISQDRWLGGTNSEREDNRSEARTDFDDVQMELHAGQILVFGDEHPFEIEIPNMVTDKGELSNYVDLKPVGRKDFKRLFSSAFGLVTMELDKDVVRMPATVAPIGVSIGSYQVAPTTVSRESFVHAPTNQSIGFEFVGTQNQGVLIKIRKSSSLKVEVKNSRSEVRNESIEQLIKQLVVVDAGINYSADANKAMELSAKLLRGDTTVVEEARVFLERRRIDASLMAIAGDMPSQTSQFELPKIMKLREQLRAQPKNPEVLRQVSNYINQHPFRDSEGRIHRPARSEARIAATDLQPDFANVSSVVAREAATLNASNALVETAQKEIDVVTSEITSKTSAVSSEAQTKFGAFVAKSARLNPNTNVTSQIAVKEGVILMSNVTTQLISAIRELAQAASSNQSREVLILASGEKQLETIQVLIATLPANVQDKINVINFVSIEQVENALRNAHIARAFVIGLKGGSDSGYAIKLSRSLDIDIRLNLFESPDQILSLFGLAKELVIKQANRIATAIAA